VSLRIGLDLDNTIISYDRAFVVSGKERGLIPHDFSGNKQQVRDYIRALPGRDGEREWQKLQGYVYGKGIMHAEIFAGVSAFLKQANEAGATLHIVSHKTQFGHYDPDKIDLREAARKFLSANGVFAALPENNVYFCTTREEKITKITELDCEIFVDDLEEVLDDPTFPTGTRKLLFSPLAKSAHGFELCRDWEGVMGAVFPDALLSPENVAKQLLEKQPQSVALAGGGGNSRIYRVEAEGKTYALKMYPKAGSDTRDRLGVEKKTLQLFEKHGVGNVPRWLGERPGYALLSWAEGSLAIAHTPENIDQAADFIGEVKRLSSLAETQDFSPASEACISGEEILRQIERRLTRLREVAPSEPALQLFLSTQFLPALKNATAAAKTTYGAHGIGFDAPLEKGLCLIPADFGFHNALQGPKTLTFIDFEYFGWDDPAKLVADFLLHPAMKLSADDAACFRARMLDLFADDPHFSLRLKALTPLFALRWALILLNEFLPERWSGRAFARGESEWAAAKERQLAKADAMVKNSMREKSDA